MELFFEISQIFATTFAVALVMPIFWIVLFLVYLQYRRQAATEQKLFGRPINRVGWQMLTSIGLGMVGGFAASAVLVFMGLSLEQIGLYFIWPVALLLLLINPRYLCFSYAGGIVAVAVLLTRHLLLPLFPGLEEIIVFEYLLRVHIPALLVLIGLLHLVEAFLIYTGGHRGSSPIYLKQDDGEVVGAFSLQRFWPLPLVALLVTLVAEPEIVGVSMPQWWPILQPALQPGEGQSLQFMVVPVAAGLGYADMALSSTPRQRTAFSAKWLAVYSVVLLILAVSAEYFPLLALPGVIFAPLGHEFLILFGKGEEQNRPLRYRQEGSAGASIMMVLPDSKAAEAGLRQDDLILKVNGDPVGDSRDLLEKIEASYFMVLLDGLREGEPFSAVLKKQSREGESAGSLLEGRVSSYHSQYAMLHRSAALGLIPVPPPDSPVYLEVRKPDPLARFKGLGKKLSRRRAGSGSPSGPDRGL